VTDHVFLSTASVAIILVGVALLATLTIGTLSRTSERGSIAAVPVSLAVIWVGAVFVVMLTKLMI
jgi:hypothetical protein